MRKHYEVYIYTGRYGSHGAPSEVISTRTRKDAGEIARDVIYRAVSVVVEQVTDDEYADVEMLWRDHSGRVHFRQY